MPLLNLSSIGCSSITYDGINLADIFEIRDVSMSALPTIEANTQDIASKPGSFFVSRKISTRSITLTLGLDAQSRCPVDIFFSFLEHNNSLAKAEPKELWFKHRFCYAMLVGDTPIENKGSKGVITCNFICYDPFFYGEEHRVPLTTGENLIPIEGTQSVFPIIELTGCESDFLLTNLKTAEKVHVQNLKSDTKLTIDMANTRCLANGNYHPSDIQVTDFFPLEAGDNRLNISSGHGTLVYRERYL